MRVNVQLIDAETGNHLWAERFDKPLADLFDMQDEIVARLAGALNAQLVAAEARRAERTANPDSMDLYFQGAAWLNKGITRDNLTKARSFFDRALDADPGNVSALVRSAAMDAVASTSQFVTDPRASLLAAESKLAKALSLVPDHASGHVALGIVHIVTRRIAQGIAECEHALALDRNLAHAHAQIGLGKTYSGRSGETEAHIVEALRLSPLDTLACIWMDFAGHAKNLLGLHEQAVPWSRRAIEANRNYLFSHINQGVALVRLDRLEEARSAVKVALALNPSFTISGYRANFTSMTDHPTAVAQMEPFLEAMRTAGVPEE
jgi:tetratricopeptide (TPR) repeat protein